MKEFDFIEHLKKLSPESTLEGIGDDAVLTGGMLIAKDIIAEDVHFTKNAPLKNTIFRLFTANVSDIAAMGGNAEKVLLGLAVPNYINKNELIDAVSHACVFYSLKLIGGDTTSSKNGLFASLTVIGTPNEHILTRSGAKKGDEVYLSRSVGSAARMLERELRGEKVYEQYMFEAETALGQLLGRFGVSSCIDISDGLGRDAHHIAKSSGVRINLDSKLIPEFDPETTTSSGEEFALLFTVPLERSNELEKLIRKDLNRDIHLIGHVVEGDGVFLNETDISERGWEHL